MLLVLVWVWHRVQPPWWDTAGDVAEMLDNQQSNLGYEGTDEYVPTGADAYEINKDAQLVAFEGESSSRIHITGGRLSIDLSLRAPATPASWC